MEFFRQHLEAGNYVAAIAEDGGSALGSGGILIHLAIPRPHQSSHGAGRVQSLYVEPAARRRGIARAIMERLLLHAREAMLVSLSLHPSEEAKSLYRSLCFEVADEMVLRLTP